MHGAMHVWHLLYKCKINQAELYPNADSAAETFIARSSVKLKEKTVSRLKVKIL